MLDALTFFAAPRLPRALIGALLCAAANGCASLKTMTADFEKKWDDPKSILAEMDATAQENRAADSSAAQMAAFNGNDCARRFDLLNPEADAGSYTARRISAGECLLDAGKNDEAAKLFSLVADEDQANALAQQGAGVALVRLGRHDAAATALRAAIAADPALWRAHNALGVAEDHLGRKEDAWALFQKAADLNPADGAALNNLGVSQMKAGLYPEAIASFRQAMALDGAREAAEANLRLVFAMDGDYAGAVRALPDDRRAVALNNAGVAAASRGDEAEARRLFARAIDESPSFYAKAYTNMSLLVD